MSDLIHHFTYKDLKLGQDFISKHGPPGESTHYRRDPNGHGFYSVTDNRDYPEPTFPEGWLVEVIDTDTKERCI